MCVERIGREGRGGVGDDRPLREVGVRLVAVAVQALEALRSLDTSRAKARWTALGTELAAVPAGGRAPDDGEEEDSVNRVAVPIIGSTGRPRGASSVSAIRAVQDVEAPRGHLGLLRAAAAVIARRLG